jgi:hypothetical protein
LTTPIVKGNTAVGWNSVLGSSLIDYERKEISGG